MFLETYNTIIGVMVLTGQIIAILLIAGLIFRNKIKENKITTWIQEHALTLAFIVSLLAFFGPLVYSEVIKFAPCKLCWLQRIAMFPQFILLGIAMIRQDIMIKFYAIPLSIIGGLISMYHYMMQHEFIFKTSSCGVVGQTGGGCGDAFVNVFGYITIPMMALTAFVLIIVLLLHGRKTN